MNVHEVAGLLAYFGSAWPKMELPDDTADIWAGELADVNVDDARAAAKRLVRSSKFFPSIAEFFEACKHEAQQRHLATQAPALEAGDAAPDFDVHAAFEELRTKLTDWSSRGHNHKGPKPCPVCSAAREEVGA